MIRTANDLSTAVGRTGTLTYDGLTIDVTVTDVRQVFQRVDYLIKPTAGGGQKWVARDRVKLHPARAAVLSCLADQQRADLARLVAEYVDLSFPDDDVRAAMTDAEAERAARRARSRAVRIADLVIALGLHQPTTTAPAAEADTHDGIVAITQDGVDFDLECGLCGWRQRNAASTNTEACRVAREHETTCAV